MPFTSRYFRLTSLTLLLVAAASLHAADTIYMQVPGIKGESTSKSHSGWINVYSMQNCISNSGKASGCEISISKDFDVASTYVYSYLLNGKGIGTSKVLVDVCGFPGGVELCYYKLELRNVRFTGASTSGASGGTRVSESLSMAFDAIKWTYYPNWYTGTPGTPVTQCWDFTTNDMTCP